MNRFELLPDEHIVLENPKHWKNYILPTAAVIGCFIGLGLRLSYPEMSIIDRFDQDFVPKEAIIILSYIEAAMMLFLILTLCLQMVAIAFTRYYVTNKRIISVAGWLNVRINEMLLERCETVAMSQKIMERIFNSGDLLCISAGASIYLDDVYDARRFRQTVMAEMTKQYEENS